MKQRTVLRIVALAAILAAIILIAWELPAKQWIESFIAWIRGLGASGAFLYGMVYAAGAIAMLPGSALTAGAGLVYGTLIGVLIVSPASVVAATASFLIARYFARDWVERKLRAYPKFAAIDRAVEKQGFKIVLLTRLQPVLPFVLLNYGLGLTRVRLRDYVIASWIGMMPATILYVYLGSALHNVSDLFSGGAAKHSPAGLALFWGGLAAGALLLWLLTRIAKRALQQELNQPAEGEVQHECHSAG
jgi:uncharacterized membrane protein YdjX (TVP38/TMEM64 family)